jgi:hypothetical protein
MPQLSSVPLVRSDRRSSSKKRANKTSGPIWVEIHNNQAHHQLIRKKILARKSHLMVTRNELIDIMIYDDIVFFLYKNVIVLAIYYLKRRLYIALTYIDLIL